MKMPAASSVETIVRLLGLISLVFSQACFLNVANLPVLSIAEASADENWKNFYAVQIGDDSAADHAKYAKQMGYSSIGLIGSNISSYRNNPDLIGFKLFFSKPAALQNSSSIWPLTKYRYHTKLLPFQITLQRNNFIEMVQVLMQCGIFNNKELLI